MSENDKNNPNDAPGPGPDLDQLICKKLGYELVKRPNAYGGIDSVWVDPATGDDVYFHGWSPEPAYSGDMNAAGLLLNYIEEYCRPWTVDISLERYKDGSTKWACLFHVPNDDLEPPAGAEEDTMPHAICLAFLALPDEVVRGK